MIKIRQNARYGVACPTSMGARITPPEGQPVHTATHFLMQATSAETNVVTVSASLGYKGLALTNFVAGSPIAQLIKNNLRSRNIEYEGPDVPQGGPWGYRHQFNIADSGYGSRGPRVHNDRAGEVGRLLNAKDYDFDRIFGVEGVGILHLSGLVAAISPETCEFCLACVEEARKHGTKICFDLNHRASFWKGREAELGAAFKKMASVADILVGNEEDFQLALGIEGPEAGGVQLSGKLERFQEMIGRIKTAYPNARVFATTLRQVISVNEHLWGSVALFRGDDGSGDEWSVIEPRPIHILDRIGGGDGFVGGLLYGILQGWKGEKCNQFGWATGAMATTLLTDYAQPADEEAVWSIYEGNARVKR